jgi:hypothetical protein
MGLRLLSVLAAAGTLSTAVDTEELLWSHAFPANFWQVGKVVKVSLSSTTSNSNSTDTLTVRGRVGAAALTGTAVFASGAVDQANDDDGVLDLEITCRSIGATGVLLVKAIGSDVDAPHSKLLGAASTSVTVDTTAATYVGYTSQWSVAHANNDHGLSAAVVTELTDGP